MERYVAIVHPFLHRTKVTKQPVFCVITMIWVSCGTLALGTLQERDALCLDSEMPCWFTMTTITTALVEISMCGYC